MRMDHARAARILITETASRADEVSVRERTATTTVTTEAETAADSVREDPRAARDSSAETETVTAREDLQDRAIPRTEARVRVMETDVISVREIIVTTVMEMAADLAREDLREIAARVDSVETETVMAREDLQDREIPRTEDHVRVMEATVDSVRAKAVTIETEMAADLVREDHRAARDVSQEKTVTTAMRDALADRITRDSAPAVQEEAAVDLMQCLHRS